MGIPNITARSCTKMNFSYLYNPVFELLINT